MNRKISYLIASVLILSVIFSFTINSEKSNRYKAYPIISISGDEPRNPNSKMFPGDIDALANHNPTPIYYSDSIVNITDVYTGQWSFYDFMSNSVTQHIVQDPNHPDTIQIAFTWNQTPGVPGTDRRCRYMVSTNGGTTWNDLGAVPDGISSGFPSIGQFDDGRTIIMSHPLSGGLGAHVVLYHDVTPLGGLFIACDPGGGASATTRVWPKFVATANNKVVFLGAYNQTWDTVTWRNTLTNTSGCQFSGWQTMFDVDNAEQYSFGRATNGTIGLVYARVANVAPYTNMGDVAYVTSTDDGLTWSTPTVIWDATPSTDFLGNLRGVDIVFVGNEPMVCFDLVHLDNTPPTGFYPALAGKIMFWSPNVNGGVAVTIVDSAQVPWSHSGAGVTGDVFTPICRGSIGKSVNNMVLFCAFNVSRPDMWSDSTNFYDAYLAWSGNGGATWSGHRKLTNFSGPVRDCRYADVSPTNDVEAGFVYANILYQNDSIPGSTINGASESPAQQHFLRVKVLDIIGVQNIGSEVPRDYVLYQNYPNPFNPTTKIRFALPTTEYVTLKVYDVTGREVAILVNNERLNAGIKEFEYNAVNLASGIYFYELKAGSFRDAKKMVIVK